MAMTVVDRESRTTWKEFLGRLKDRGLNGVELVVSDNHQGLKRAVMEMLREAAWQRCYVLAILQKRGYPLQSGG